MTLTLPTKDFATESGHWYDKDGAPRYSIVGKNGKERATTLRDAREHGLVPSVTTILRLEAAPGLERWKIEQACMACLTLPRLDDESDDQFMARAQQDAKEQARKASERGTYLHGLIEQSLSGQIPEGFEANDFAIVAAVREWITGTFPGFHLRPERSFAHPDGFGGKLDLFAEHEDGRSVVVDFKTKAKIGGKSERELAYPEHQTQLAAYAYGLGKPKSRCINLFIDTDVPGLIVVREWSKEEIATGWEAFKCLLKLWKLRKGL